VKPAELQGFPGRLAHVEPCDIPPAQANGPTTDIAGCFRLDDHDVRQVLCEVSDATSRWRTVARETGLDRAAIEQMAPAFEHDQASRAREIAGARDGGKRRLSDSHPC